MIRKLLNMHLKKFYEPNNNIYKDINLFDYFKNHKIFKDYQWGAPKFLINKLFSIFYIKKLVLFLKSYLENLKSCFLNEKIYIVI